MTMSDPVPFSPGITFEPAPAAEALGEGHDFSPARSPGHLALEPSSPSSHVYYRYHIEIQTTPDIVPFPPRFRVKVNKHRLMAMVLKELFAFKGNLPVALSRPCVYGVFSRPVGGLAPREELCVGCLRCTVQYPDVVQIYPNPQRQRLGDSFVKPEYVDTILYEARTGRVPVHGAGYRGPFGGEGWDGLWTDMSEIVRPTRDGIHGREFISTAVDIGEKPAFLCFDDQGEAVGPVPTVIATRVPFLFDVPANAAQSRSLLQVLTEAARQIETLVVVSLPAVIRFTLAGQHVVPMIAPEAWTWLDRLSWSPRMVVLDGWDRERYDALRHRFPGSLVCIRVPMDTNVLELVRQGVRVFHLTANYHGYVGDRFVMDLILQAHQRLVDAGVREEVTLIGSGGIILAEHVPKAIICGLDAVALDVALAVALQARFTGECLDRETVSLAFPRLNAAWGVQRLKNLAASWRDQLLEVLGAMGLREVRRLRGEIGRCMFQKDLEREVFGDEAEWQNG
jgi:glutamate synthase-like protein